MAAPRLPWNRPTWKHVLAKLRGRKPKVLRNPPLDSPATPWLPLRNPRRTANQAANIAAASKAASAMDAISAAAGAEAALAVAADAEAIAALAASCRLRNTPRHAITKNTRTNPRRPSRTFR